MTWRPSNEPTRYDRARVAQLGPIKAQIERLGLPLIRFRKLNGILNALEMQIEDGGDSPEVNGLLLDALRAAVRHQVSGRKNRAALRTIDVFEQAEAKRWEQVKAGILPPIELTPEEQLNDVMQGGYDLMMAGESTAACDRWLEAWEMVKQLARPEMRTVTAFDDAYPGLLQCVFNWCSDLETELHNAGLRDPIYHEHRLRYAQEFLAQFPDEDALRHVNFMRAQGEALWNLGRRAEAEAVYAELVKRLPDQAWGYIGWADNYWLWSASEPKEFDKAEAILQRALARPDLRDRDDVLERLEGLYGEWGKPQEQAAVAVQRQQLRTRPAPAPRPSSASFVPTPPPPEASPPAEKSRAKRKRRRRRGKRK